jgi:hypothetical protein
MVNALPPYSLRALAPGVVGALNLRQPEPSTEYRFHMARMSVASARSRTLGQYTEFDVGFGFHGGAGDVIRLDGVYSPASGFASYPRKQSGKAKCADTFANGSTKLSNAWANRFQTSTSQLDFLRREFGSRAFGERICGTQGRRL